MNLEVDHAQYNNADAEKPAITSEITKLDVPFQGHFLVAYETGYINTEILRHI